MGSCVSLSLSRPPPALTVPAELGRQVAKVVDLDGSMARFEGSVTAHEALLVESGRHGASPPSCFLCSADELGFDAPARALFPDEPLQPGQLYFVLPASALHRPLSGQDMAALAVKAARALAVEAGHAATTHRRRRKGGRGDGEDGNKRRKATRVAHLAVALSSSSKESSQSSAEGASWKNKHQWYANDSGRTVGKTRHHGVVRDARRRAVVQRLSAIAEGSE